MLPDLRKIKFVRKHFDFYYYALFTRLARIGAVTVQLNNFSYLGGVNTWDHRDLDTDIEALEFVQNLDWCIENEIIKVD